MPIPTVTAQDLQDWSPRLDARAHLPTLIRRLIFASVRPEQIVVPDAEGTGLPGLDGILFSTAGAPPYVPAGRSAWEFKTSGDPQNELGKDYQKRTKQLTNDERATTTIVLVTTRIWDRTRIEPWIARRRKDGWADIKVISAEDLATWLPQCPGVLSWLEDHCGRNPYGRIALSDWWEDWSHATEPAIPPGVLLSGRSVERDGILTALAGAPTSTVIATGTEEEAIAFLAAALLAPRPLKPTEDGQEASEEELDAFRNKESSWREAILERTVIVSDTNAWRSLAAHHERLILVPTATCAPTIDAALKSGHSVILPQTARPGEPSLPKLGRAEARQAWEAAGVPWNESDELARAARRSVTSLRRRRGRAGYLRRPPWSSGPSSTLLAPLLLAGSWDAAMAGDERIVLELADRQSLRSLDRDLAAIASEPDPPIRRSRRGWQFVDPVDAWDQLAPVISHHDLDVFRERATQVLTYRDSTLDLTTAQRLAAELRGERTRPEYSQSLRDGVAETIAILGAIRDAVPLPGSGTGAGFARQIVHDLIHDASATRWLEVVDVLPNLAEAAPSTFLDAVEESLHSKDCPVLSLFDEQGDDLAIAPYSPHTPLLWALEHLAFSPAHVARVAVVLGILTENDPGGTLQNRPANSLRDALHLVFPQSAVDSVRRLAAIDALRAAAPQASWSTMLGLVRSLDRGMVLNRDPRYRDWPRAETATRRDVFDGLVEVGDRILADVSHDPTGRWPDAISVITRMPASARTQMLINAGDNWDEFDNATQRAIVAELKSQVTRHAKYRDSTWALDDAGLVELANFVDAHATEAHKPDAHLLFSFWPEVDGIDPHTIEGQVTLGARREDAVRARLSEDALRELAIASELPEQIGATLAAITDGLDETVLEWLSADESSLQKVGSGLARARQDQDRDWLQHAMTTHEKLAVELLLTTGLTPDVITRVGAMNDADQSAFWSRVSPWSVPDELLLQAARQLADRDRPFSAMNLLVRCDTDAFPIDLGLDVMAKPLTGTGESVEALDAPGYVMQGMLDRLADAGAPIEYLAVLEWWYNPTFRHERTPAAFNATLARDPVLFAQLVELTTPSDDELKKADQGTSGQEARSEIKGDLSQEEGLDCDHADAAAVDVVEEGAQNSIGLRFSDTPENRINAFEVLRDWSLPIPGSIGDEPPTTAALEDWVDRALGELATRKRSVAGAYEVGQALSGPVVDSDGTWPCRAVRDLLERVNDSRIESQLSTGRFNSRGVTVRDPYSGGKQERDLAARHKEWADQVRDRWPRAGAVLDSISEFYTADALREDRTADELADR